MKRLLDLLSIHNVQCSVCGAFTGLTWKSHCQYCINLFKSELFLRSRNENGVDHVYAVAWVPGQSDLISYFLLSLKSKPSWDLYQDLARLWLGNLAKTKGLAPTLLIPIPSRRRPNQAQQLAQSIAELSGFEVWNGLFLADPTEQKKQSRKARKKRKIEVHKNFTLTKLSHKRIILIDDVLTTGATVQAAFKALQGFKIFEVWTIAYREENPIRLKLKD